MNSAEPAKPAITATIRKLLQLLDRRDRLGLVGLFAVMAITGLLQTAGVASIMPFLAVVSNPSVISENKYLSRAYDAFAFQSTDQFIIALGIVFIVLTVGGTVFSALSSWSAVRFQWRCHTRISIRLLETYLGAPYQFHLDHNSARLTSTLLTQLAKVMANLLLPTTQIVAKAISSALMVCLLVAVSPLLALTGVVTIGGFYALVYGVVRKRQSRLGEQSVLARTESQKAVAEGLGGVKEISVFGRGRYFLERFSEPLMRYADAQHKNELVGLMPRVALETIAYGGIVVVILFLLRERATMDRVFPLLAVYAFGANRLIPAVQEIFGGVTKIRFYGPAVDELYRDIFDPDLVGASVSTDVHPRGGEAAHAPFTLDEGIELRDLGFKYPASGPVLTRVNLRIPAKQTIGLVGSTGSGKTTLVDILTGLLIPTEGAILIDGTVLEPRTLSAWRKAIGYVPQTIYLRDASIAENIAFGVPPDQIDPLAIEEAARAASLEQFVATLPAGFQTPVGERGVRLSGGQRQRIGIARALYHRPLVLLMDEATSALDNLTEDDVMQAIRALAKQRTIILVAHRLTTVRECDTIYLLEQGTVTAAGTYDELVASNPTFRAMTRTT